MKSSKLKIIIFSFIVIICFAFLYYNSISSYSSYESSIDGSVASKVSGIKLNINGQDVILNSENGVILDNIILNSSSHTRPGTISPGADGNISFTLDPSESGVAILYDFTIIDKQKDANKLLTCTGFKSSNGNLIRTGENTYTGLITLDDINNKKVIDLSLEFIFDDEEVEGITSDDVPLENFISINFHAVQYNGEEIVPYSE